MIYRKGKGFLREVVQIKTFRLNSKKTQTEKNHSSAKAEIRKYNKMITA